MSSSSGGSESTASMREGAMETSTNPDPKSSLVNGEQHLDQHEESPEEDSQVEETKNETMTENTSDTKQQQQTPENRMASVITINGSDADRDHDVAYVEMNSGKGSSRSDKSGFDNPGFVDDGGHGRGSSGVGKVVNGGGGLSPPTSPPPRPPSPAGPFLNSAVTTTPTPSGGANGRGPIMETPNSNLHNNSGLIMTPNEKEKGDIDGGTNVTEAVNLELVNMNPYGGAGLGIGDEVAGGKSGTNGGLNGIPVKRGAGDEETGDGGFGDPYDEYFVPVNEHRKYMRGEKLYVTKDRRRSQSWRRCIYWGVGFTLIAVVILIAVLAGTGVILSQEEEGNGAVEERSFSSSIPRVAESRDPNVPIDKDLHPTSLPPEPSSSYTPPPSMSSVPVTPPTTEMNGLYVPRLLEAEMRIENLEYTSDLQNSSSSQFKELAHILEEELKSALFDHQTVNNGPADIFIKVINFQPGSVVAIFQVGWRFKDSFPLAHDPIDIDSLNDRLEAHLLNNGRYLYTYHITPGTIKSTHVMDLCQIDNGGCSHECRYDYEEAKFMCNCPPGLFLDQTEKKCTTDLMDDSITNGSTEGPKLDKSPWMPIEPEEPVFTAEVEKPSETDNDASEEETHSDEDMHKETDGHETMHGGDHSHFQPTYPMETEDKKMPEINPESDEEEHKMNDSMNEGGHTVHKDPEMNESKEPVHEHHEVHQLVPSVGTGRSGGDDMMVVEHSTEEHHPEHDAENDTEHGYTSLDEEKQREPGEKSTESEEEIPSKEEMEKLGHSVDSSENTSVEEHDSKEVHHSHKETNEDGQDRSQDMSGGEVTDGSDEYKSSSHSSSNELHGETHIAIPISESATSENPHWNGLESHESDNHEGPEVDVHIHASGTPTDEHETFNETEHQVDGGALKSEIISAVESVIVKDESEAKETIDEGHEEKVGHNWESMERVNESNHDMEEEVVAHVVMEGEMAENKDGDMLEPKEEGMMKNHEEETSEHKEDKMSEHRESEMTEKKDVEKVEHKDGVMMVHAEEMEGHNDEEMTEHKEGEMAEHNDEISEHKDFVMMEHKEGDMDSSSHDNTNNVVVEGKDEHDVGHLTVVNVEHDENDVVNHEVDHKAIEAHEGVEVPVEGGDGETGRRMHELENPEEKPSEDSMVHIMETDYGNDGHEMDMTAMNHEKPTMENESKKELEANENVDHNFGVPVVVVMDHTESEGDKVNTETESSMVAAGENEADVADEKPIEKERVGEGLWVVNQDNKAEHEEMHEHVVHSTEEHVFEDVSNKQHDVNEAPIVGTVVLAEDHEETTMMSEGNMKEVEDKVVLMEHVEEPSMEKPSEEETSTEKMEDPVTVNILSHVDELANALKDSEEEAKNKSAEEGSDVDSSAALANEETHKHDGHNVEIISTPIPSKEISNEDEDPNIVPVEETPKETTVDYIDAKKMSISPDIDVRTGLDEIEGAAMGEKNDTETNVMKEDHVDTSDVNLTSILGPSTESESQDGISKMPMDHEMEVVGTMPSSTTSPAENSIESLSDHYKSNDSVHHLPPTAENDLSALPGHFVVPISVFNESSTVMTTPSPKENNIDDPPLHMQAGITMMVSEEPSAVPITSTSEPAFENDLSSLGHDFMPSPVEHAEKEESTDEKILELDNVEKIIDEMKVKFGEEVVKDEEHSGLMSAAGKASEKEEKMMKEDKLMELEKKAQEGEMVDENLKKDEEKMLMEGEEKEEPKSDSKEEVSSISTIHQDFTVEHANTVHAINPTSPSTIIEETPKEESVSDSSIPRTLETHDMHALEGAVNKDGDHAPEPHLPFETDDNERSNNLAALDNEDSVAVPEEGTNGLVKVGAVDVGLKSTTEHANEILAVSTGPASWPATALEAHNVTETQTEPEMKQEGHQTESSVSEESKSGEVTKTDLFGIPMKKKGDFKKSIHHEDEITKPLFGKEGKEGLNKVDKIGLLPVVSTMIEDSSEDMISEEVDGSSATSTEMPSISEKNDEIGDGSSMETGVTLSSTPADKGRERLNAIGEDESGHRKDLGKTVMKETTKENEDSVTINTETTEKDGQEKEMKEEKEERNMTDEMHESIVTTEKIIVHKVDSTDVMHEHKDEIDEMKESKEEEVPKSEESGELLGIHPTEMPLKEEETTIAASDNTDLPSNKNGNEEMIKEIDVAMTNKVAMGENEEATTKMNVAGETIMPTSTEGSQAQENIEEMLIEMGGFGEGGHKVVAKSGVEPIDSHKDIHQDGTTTERMDLVEAALTSSVQMVSSSTSIPSTPLPPLSVESEQQMPTTLPPEDKTMKLEVNNNVEEKSSSEEINHDLMDSSKNGSAASSEDPIPTMIIHEIVPSNSISSTASPVESEVSSPKDSAETTLVEEVPEMTTSNGMLDLNLTTLPSDSAGATMPPHESEILVKDETSNIAEKDSDKEVAAMNPVESSLESNKSVSETDGNMAEKTLVQDHGTSINTTSALPELDQQFFSKCTAGQFQCTNGTSLTPYSVMPISSSSVASLAIGVACVPLSAKCDSINDCSDGSDELGCIEEGCPGNFQCSNGQCLKRHLVCNGIIDCNDGSDEASCEKWQCQFDEFQCPSGRCIPVLWLCDGKPDCDNHTDEYNCQGSCGNDEYLCPERWCIPMSWRCNGVPECANGEDEKLCDCSLEQVKCGTGGCVARNEVCDGVEQCPDQSDEWGCVRLHNETMKLEVRTTENEWLSVCADRWDNNWSHFVCQSFGYSRSMFTEYKSVGDFDDSSEVFILKPGASITLPPGNTMRLPGVLQRASSTFCSSGSTVEISCHEFTCGNHGLADGVAARLVGGDEAANGQWPSVALLYHARQRATCTASIISPRWLIASYNCLHMREKSLSPDGWVAFGGGSTFDKDKPETQIKNVRSIVPYPQVKYNRFLYNHDVALVELDEPLTFTQSVGAICLPDKPIEPRQLCVTAGWGYTSPGEINFSQYLHYLPVPTIDLNECNSTKHYSGFITEDKICAGFTDAMHSPCYNDEGAPLMCVSEGGIWELQGVLSYHSNCGRGYHPSIFSSVTAVRDWVKRIVGGRFERRSTFNVRRRRRTKRRRRFSGNQEMTNIIWT